MKHPSTCPLCAENDDTVLWQSSLCRVIRVRDPDYPGFCRVIWGDHVREMTDLPVAERQVLMNVVFAVEQVVRRFFKPDKINLASFGNMVPHLHWHVIPRWEDDRHFPEPIWGKEHRVPSGERCVIDDASLRAALLDMLGAG